MPVDRFKAITSIIRHHHIKRAPRQSPSVIFQHHRIIVAIGKHVIAHNALSSADVDVRADEPAPRRIIVPARQIIQPGFGIVEVTPIAQGVAIAQDACHGAGGGEQLAPSVVGVGHHLRAGGVYQPRNIPLCVAEIVVVCVVSYTGAADN